MAKLFFSFVSAYLISLYMCSNSVDATPVDGEVVNPDDLTDYEMPASCANDNFCFEKGDSYPDGKIKELLKNMQELPVEEPTPRIGTGLTFRYADEPNRDHTLCPTNETYVNKPIYYIYDKMDKVRVVVQSEIFKQIYSVRWCQYPGPITSRKTEQFMENSAILTHNKVECVNTIMDFDFFVLSEFDNKIEIANAKDGIPVCCRCRYTKLW